MAATYEPIQTTTLVSAQTTVTLSAIPQTYTDLVLVIGNAKETAGTPSVIAMRFNGDTATNYSTTYMGASSVGGLFSGRRSSDTGIWLGGMYGNIGMFKADIMNYRNTTTFKTLLSRQAIYGTTYEPTGAYIGVWRKTPEAITSMTIYTIDLTPTFAIGTTFSLYGIKSA